VAVCESQSPSLTVDTITIRNGDRITGEIKELKRGTLTLKTDDIGTVAIEWDKIVRMVSPRPFEIELVSGVRLIGSLGDAGPRRLALTSPTETDSIAVVSIVSIVPVFGSLLLKFDGYLDLGFTYQQANNLIQYSLGSQVAYRTPLWLSSVRVSSFLQSQEGADQTIRNSLGLLTQRFIGPHWAAIGLMGLEQNRELGLDLRFQTGLGAGYTLARTYRSILQGSAGLTYTREQFQDVAEAENSMEAFVGGIYDFFRADRPKTDLNFTGTVYPSLTTLGRVRAQANVRLAYEVLKSFTVGTTIFEFYDSRPEGEASKTNDFGVTLTVGWTF